MERRPAFPIRRDSRSRMAEKTVIRSLCRLKTYDESLSVLRRALQQAKVGHTEKIDGLGRLDRFTRMVEKQGSARSRF